MPQVDLTTDVADGAKALLSRVRARIKERIFLGPGVVKLSPKEALARLQAMTPDERQALMRQKGRDVFMNELESLLLRSK